MTPSHINSDWSAEGSQSHGNAFVMLHRLLRGRYVVTLIAAAALAVAGGAAGYLSQKPLFMSESIIQIQPVMPKILYETEQSSAPRMFSSLVASQAELMQGGRVLERAMESDKWREVAALSGVTTADDFRSHLLVRTNRSSQELITVVFEHENARIAQIGNQALLEAYMELHGNESSISSEAIMGALESRRTEVRQQKQTIDQQIKLIATEWGTDQLDRLSIDALELVTQLSAEKRILDAQVEEIEMIASRTGEEGEVPQITEERAAELDPRIAELLAMRRELESQRTGQLASNLLPGHRQVRQIDAGLVEVNAQLSRRIADLQTAILSGQAGGLGAGGLTIEEIRVRRDRLAGRLGAAQERLSRLNGAGLELRDLFIQREDIENEIAHVENRITAVRTESQVEDFSEVSGRISVASPATLPPVPTMDKRIKMAAAGFVGGAAVPVMAMLGLGLMGRRVRFSDDDILESANSRIVGVLPDLGRSITDRELAEASAFAVHQIRSQLQILYGTKETAVFAVTSPAPGDGKTSMIIALGLSFAESGDRTLLVDMDLIGRGLSLHFSHPRSESLAEAISTDADLSAMVHGAGFERLWVLPAGFGDEHRISRLSPAVVRRLVESFRGRYDTVLIDSGPILGSIEAGLLAPAVDGMLMVVGRGQLRPLVKRAVDQISAVGGQVIATVFNRASVAELRQSSSSMSVHFSRQASRQAAEQAGGGGSRGVSLIGPLAGSLLSAREADEAANTGRPS